MKLSWCLVCAGKALLSCFTRTSNPFKVLQVEDDVDSRSNNKKSQLSNQINHRSTSHSFGSSLRRLSRRNFTKCTAQAARFSRSSRSHFFRSKSSSSHNETTHNNRSMRGGVKSVDWLKYSTGNHHYYLTTRSWRRHLSKFDKNIVLWPGW